MRISVGNEGWRQPLSSLQAELAANRELEVEITKPQIQVQSEHVTVEIDNYPSQYDIGYRKPLDLTQDLVEESREAIAESRERIVRSGDMMMEFQEHDIADVAEAEVEPEKVEAGLSFRRGPDFQVHPHHIEVELIQE